MNSRIYNPNQLKEDFRALVDQEFALNCQPDFKKPKEITHGDLSTSLVLSLFPQLGGKSNQYHSPIDLAQTLVTLLQDFWRKRENLSADPFATFEKIEVAGPGFINFWFTNKYLSQVSSGLTGPFIKKELSSGAQRGKKVIIEFTDPNPFKEFHIGHLYSNIVGETISRLQEAVGATVKRACYQGDVGMHVAKSVWGMLQKLQAEAVDSNFETVFTKLSAASLDQKAKFLGAAYALGASAYEENPQVKQEIQLVNYYTFLAGQEYIVTHEGWQPQVDYRQYLTQSKLNYQQIKGLYEAGKQWSLEYFAAIYQRLGTKFDYLFFESQMGEVGIKIVKEFLKKGVFEVSQGAVIFPGKKHGLHDRVFINSLGLPTYEAKELGLAPSKYARFAYDQSIIITGNEIDEYFKVLLKAMSFTHPDLAAKTKHLSHGMVRLPQGKMSSRTGKVLTGEWLINEAKELIAQRLARTKPALELSKRGVIAEQIALGAIKYALLKSSIGDDTVFSFEESLALTGNSGPYLQYTVVRCFSVLRKAAHQFTKGDTDLLFDTLSNIKIDTEDGYTSLDRIIQRYLTNYLDVVRLAAQENAPQQLATYLYNLAQQVNVWYDRERILDPAAKQLEGKMAAKLNLIKAIVAVMTHGLGLIGISIPEEM